MGAAQVAATGMSPRSSNVFGTLGRTPVAMTIGLANTLSPTTTGPLLIPIRSFGRNRCTAPIAFAGGSETLLHQERCAAGSESSDRPFVAEGAGADRGPQHVGLSQGLQRELFAAGL